MYNNYDEEFGPNQVERCPTCKGVLSPQEICFCRDIEIEQSGRVHTINIDIKMKFSDDDPA